MMKPLNFLLCAFLVLLLSSTGQAQTFSGRLTSSFYTFERSDTTNKATTQARGYQSFQFDLRNKNFLFRTFGQLESDLSTRLAGDGKVRMYNFYLQWKDRSRNYQIGVGRQPVFSGIAVGTVDGLQVKARVARWLRLRGFAGGLLPAHQKLKIVEDLDKNYMAGGQVQLFPAADLRVGLSYLNKRQSRASYRSIRADSVGNVFTQLIEPDDRAFQFASLDAAWNRGDNLSLYARTDYDLYSKDLSRLEFSARTTATEQFTLHGSYTFRSPRLPRSSIFSFFNIEDNHEVEGGAYYRSGTVGVYGNVAGIFYQNDESLRGTVGVDFSYGGVNYVRRGGYAGTLNGLNGMFYYPLLENKLMPSLQLSWASYKLDSDAPDAETLFSGAAGLLFQPAQAISIDGQIQVLHNKYYSNDARFFLRVQYLFFNRIGK